ADSGEGRWTALEAIEQGVPAPVLSLALIMRFASQGKGEYADRLLSMMRKSFGGHKIERVAEGGHRIERVAEAGHKIERVAESSGKAKS
ncbi:MAG TPA: hypothetical protein VIM74_04125, partial [Casimicrobiaceae bacterium]